MYSELRNLRKEYELIKNGKGDIFAARGQALSILKRLRDLDDQELLEEFEDILLDLEITLNNIMCNCQSRSCLRK